MAASPMIHVLSLAGASFALCFLFISPTSATTCSDVTLGYNAVYDLQNNLNCADSNILVHQSFTGSGCSKRGVLRLAMNNSTRHRVLIDFYLSSPNLWVFNLGDSSTNNGWGGDASTTQYDAEVQGYGTTLAGYRSDVASSGLSFSQGSAYSTRLTMIAANGKVSWLSDTSDDAVTDSGLYALNGQDSNYDLYLGLNRVVYGSRSGSGLCKVAIRFLP